MRERVSLSEGSVEPSYVLVCGCGGGMDAEMKRKFPQYRIHFLLSL